jgi:DNA (cytosine-5)-methyltransferase 1
MAKGRSILLADLYDFEIYRSPSAGNQARRYELTSLHLMDIPSSKKLCLAGLIRIGGVQHYLQDVLIKASSVSGYGADQNPTVEVYVQSEEASQDSTYDIWFRLQKPSSAYRRYHEPYLWVAQLAKHVLDYMQDEPPVGLEDFKRSFSEWLMTRFSHHSAFQHWHAAFHGQTDFRVGVNAYIKYLYLEAYRLPNSAELLAHPLWTNCMANGLTCVPAQHQLVEHTLATLEVYECFQDMYFGAKIRRMAPSPQVKAGQERRKRKMGFCPVRTRSLEAKPHCRSYGSSPIMEGDIVAFDPDRTDQSLWRNANWEWLAYVQSTQTLKNGVQRLYVLYLYRPRETNIFKAKYRFADELLFSDNCNCTEGELLSTEINGKYDVEWSPLTIPMKGFFIRQTYVTQDSAFRTFRQEDKVCMCRQKKPSLFDKYNEGDTVYTLRSDHGRKILEPVLIKKIDKASNEVVVQKLARLKRDFIELAKQAGRTNIAANELVLTDKYDTLPVAKLQRRCSVLLVKKQDVLGQRIPFPYNQGGAGDFWFISMALASNDRPRLMFLAKLPAVFNEGCSFDAPTAAKKLVGLSIFSGGGNLDRGLEEGGAVEFHTAVDFSAEAVHTQRANAANPGLQLFCGSVDDYLHSAFSGKEGRLIAKVGAVNFIAAGSPCPGMSSCHTSLISL